MSGWGAVRRFVRRPLTSTPVPDDLPTKAVLRARRTREGRDARVARHRATQGSA